MIWEWDYRSGNETINDLGMRLQMIWEWDYKWSENETINGLGMMQIGNRTVSICYRYRECQKLKYQPRNDTTGEHYFMWCRYQTGSAIGCLFSSAAAPAPEASRGNPAKRKRLDNEDNTGHELFQAWVVVSCITQCSPLVPSFKTCVYPDLFPSSLEVWV